MSKNIENQNIDVSKALYQTFMDEYPCYMEESIRKKYENAIDFLDRNKIKLLGNENDSQDLKEFLESRCKNHGHAKAKVYITSIVINIMMMTVISVIFLHFNTDSAFSELLTKSLYPSLKQDIAVHSIIIDFWTFVITKFLTLLVCYCSMTAWLKQLRSPTEVYGLILFGLSSKLSINEILNKGKKEDRDTRILEDWISNIPSAPILLFESLTFLWLPSILSIFIGIQWPDSNIFVWSIIFTFFSIVGIILLVFPSSSYKYWKNILNGKQKVFIASWFLFIISLFILLPQLISLFVLQDPQSVIFKTTSMFLKSAIYIAELAIPIFGGLCIYGFLKIMHVNKKDNENILEILKKQTGDEKDISLICSLSGSKQVELLLLLTEKDDSSDLVKRIIESKNIIKSPKAMNALLLLQEQYNSNTNEQTRSSQSQDTQMTDTLVT